MPITARPAANRRAVAARPPFLTYLKNAGGSLRYSIRDKWGDLTMTRNTLYLVIAVLAVAAVVFGYQLYQERQKTTGIEINVGKSGISIEKK